MIAFNDHAWLLSLVSKDGSFFQVVVTSLLAAALAWLGKIIYNVYFHPLSHYPGPRLYAASSIPLSIAQLRGRWHLFVQAAHEQYGPVVRVAWKDTCARREGNAPLPRDRTFFNEMLVDPRTMTMANNADHARLRRALNPAFSQKALLEQESILQGNVDVLLDQIGERARRGLTSDLRAWYNYTTFDLIGDLAFGDTFGCLRNSQFHEWVQMVLDYFYAAILLQVVHRYRPLNRLLAMLLPSSVVQKKERHTQMALDKVRARTSSAGMSGRHDFIHYMQRAVEAGSITSEELEMQASIIILAGSETTSIALTYATYFLITHPEILDGLRAELAEHFTREDEITLLAVNQLQFLQAALQETLRLRPPITNGFPRQTPPQGAVIDGRYVPGNTVVNVHHWAAYHSAANFLHPDDFHPGRWMGDERFAGDSRDSFQPFSVGPRDCVGKKFAYDSMKLILARLLWRYDLAIDDESVVDGGRRESWIDAHRAYVSWHVPELHVKVIPRR
ncbi:cytochrome P450 [Aspergillus germanicus]